MTQNEPTSRINRLLRDLWSDCFSENRWPVGLPRLWPLQYQAMQTGKLLFVGLNPSFQESDSDLLAVRSPPDADLASEERAAEVLRRDETAMGLHGAPLYSYFAPFARFAPDAQWNHIDLLALRHRNQAQVAEALDLRSGLGASKFALQQARIAMSLAHELCPPAVVVVNALASDLLTAYLAEQRDGFLWDDESGHHWAPLGGRRIAWFFSGMLTGQRALDKHSVKRLVWQVRCVLRGGRTSD